MKSYLEVCEVYSCIIYFSLLNINVLYVVLKILGIIVRIIFYYKDTKS